MSDLIYITTYYGIHAYIAEYENHVHSITPNGNQVRIQVKNITTAIYNTKWLPKNSLDFLYFLSSGLKVVYR